MSIIDYAASGNNSVNGINIATGCNPANVDNALRAITDDIGSALRTGYFATVLPSTKSAGYAVLTSDRGKLFNCTATLTLTLPAAATCEAGFMFMVKANGAVVTIDPNGAELIDGAATVIIASGSNAVVACTGTAWITAFGVVPYDWAAAVVAAAAKATPIDADSIGLVDSAASNVLKETTIGELKAVIFADSALTTLIAAAGGKSVRRLYTSGATWSKPSSASFNHVVVTVLGGGGGSGGKNSSSGSFRGGNGGGGGAAIKKILAASLGATETITVGAGGTAGGTGSNGGAGGTSSFGAHCTGTGGGGGTFANGAIGVDGDAGGATGGDIVLYGGTFRGNGVPNGSNSPSGSPSALGDQGAPGFQSTGNGIPASSNSGAGASPGMHGFANTATGAAGGSGLVIVEEYYV